MNRLHAAFFLLFLSGCGKKHLFFKDAPFETLMENGQRALSQKRYDTAYDLFLEAERQHPLHSGAADAMLYGAYAAYQDKAFENSEMILSRFVVLYPTHPSIAYACYLKALCYYQCVVQVFCDSSSAHKSLEAFQEIIDAFPQTAYADDARVRKDFLRWHLASKELGVGRFLMERKAHVGAYNRFCKLHKRFPDTTLAPEALYRAVECLLKLGMTSEARKHADLLSKKYPASPWTARAQDLINTRALRSPVRL